MEIDIKGASPALFIDAVTHLRKLGVERLVVFEDRRQTEGPWMVAFVIIECQRYVRWTGESWQGRTLDEQARDLAKELEAFVPRMDLSQYLPNAED